MVVLSTPSVLLAMIFFFFSDEHIRPATTKDLDHVRKSSLLHSLAQAIERFGGSMSQI